VWTVNTNLSFEPIIKYLFGCKGTNFSTKLQIFLALFFCLRRSMRIMGRFFCYTKMRIGNGSLRLPFLCVLVFEINRQIFCRFKRIAYFYSVNLFNNFKLYTYETEKSKKLCKIVQNVCKCRIF
jgi:hypothetical protein